MKRAVFIVLAVFFALLSYPSTNAQAAVSASDGPSIVPSLQDGGGFGQANDNDGCDGDADDLSGYKTRQGKIDINGTIGNGAPVFDSYRSVIWVWWNLMVLIR